MEIMIFFSFRPKKKVFGLGCEKSFLSRVGHAWSGESIREHGIDRGGPERFLPRPTVCSPESWWVPSNPILHGFSPGEKKGENEKPRKNSTGYAWKGAFKTTKRRHWGLKDSTSYFILFFLYFSSKSSSNKTNFSMRLTKENTFHRTQS